MKNISEFIDDKVFLRVLDEYHPEEVNKLPMTEVELLKKYDDYTAPVLKYAKMFVSDGIFPLGNEVRAMFGHLADYRIKGEGKTNLEDAYGHYRRLNIDVLKIFCDEFDKFFLSELKHTYHYDFRNVRAGYLKNFAQKYFSAKKSYMSAKYKENVGNDRPSDVISPYFQAVYSYAKLYEFFKENKKGIKAAKVKAISVYAVELIISLLGIAMSIINL